MEERTYVQEKVLILKIVYVKLEASSSHGVQNYMLHKFSPFVHLFSSSHTGVMLSKVFLRGNETKEPDFKVKGSFTERRFVVEYLTKEMILQFLQFSETIIPFCIITDTVCFRSHLG